MEIDRKKYLSNRKIKQLRTIAESRSLLDIKNGLVMTGILTWMSVDFALFTGLRVLEIAALKIEDIDFESNALTVVQPKRRRSTL